MAIGSAKSLRKIQFSSDVVLELMRGDITLFEGDAIVNAANEHLQHGGGVARAISQAGGPAIQKESNEWISKHGQIDFQNPAYTSGGSMACKFVLHAVGPIWGEGDEARKLGQTITAALTLGTELGISSIAFPAISTGIFGFPVEQAAGVFMRSFDKWANASSVRQLTRIYLVLFSSKTAEIFQHIFDNFEWTNIR